MDSEERSELRGPIAWYCAIILPLTTIAGGFLHYFDPQVSALLYHGFLVLWLTAIAALVYEVSTLENFEDGYTLSNLIVGLLMLSILFGPGLFLGSIWLRITPH